MKQVLRGRLFDQLNDGSSRALTLIIAPAGYGKTSLAAAWAAKPPLPIAWLSLNPTEKSRERFLTYLVQAIQTVSPKVGHTSLAMLQNNAMEGALIALINDLSEPSDGLALVLDDYYLVDSPQINQIVQYLLDNRPASFHLMIVSRAMPSLYLARLRAHGQVIEITIQDLKFTLAEAQQFFELQTGPNPVDDRFTHLYRVMEGWAAGLQLASLARTQQADTIVAASSHEHIFEYLAEEIFRREPADVQEFLVISALFDRFCLPMCVYLYEATKPVGQNPDEISSLLHHIEHNNLFLSPLDQAGVWFRYHTLFTDFLRRQSSNLSLEPLFQAAGEWCEANGLLDEAIHYSIHAANYQRAAESLEANYRDLLQKGEQTAILEWIQLLPIDVLQSRPKLWLARGWAAVVAFDYTLVDQCIEEVEARIPGQPDGELLLSELRSLQILRKVFAGEEISNYQITSSVTPAAREDAFLHCIFHFNLGLYHVVEGNSADVIDQFNETLQQTKLIKNPLISIIAQVLLGETRQIRGAFGLAERNFQQVFAYAREVLGENTLLLGFPYISYADLLREQNRFQEARLYLEKGIQGCQDWQPITSMDGEISLARLLAAEGAWEEADVHLERALSLTKTSSSILDDTFVVVHMARLALLRGDWQKAGQIIEAYDLEKHSQVDRYFVRELICLLMCRYQLARLENGLPYKITYPEDLAVILSESEKRERVTPQIEGLLLSACTQHALRNPDQAYLYLSKALTLGAQAGYVRTFADEGSHLLTLIDLYRSRLHGPAAYIDRLITLMREEIQPDLDHDIKEKDKTHSLNGLDSLTRRELDILQLLAEGKSNQEIAAIRVLTLNTVKKHVANILAKMEVANRTQAVNLARKAGWIP